MKYTLEPLNEGAEMNVRTSFAGTRQGAFERASLIASTLQNLLPDCLITCRIKTPPKGIRETRNIVALCDGTFIDEEKGGFVKA